MADDAYTERVTFTIATLASSMNRGSLTVHLPTHRDVTGIWRPVIQRPEELLAPLANGQRRHGISRRGRPGRTRMRYRGGDPRKGGSAHFVAPGLSMTSKSAVATIS